MSEMLTPGKILKYYRIKKELSLSDVSSATKIPVEQLQQIEKDAFNNPESEVFYKGFIKNYSDYLNLDTDKILAIFRRTMAATKPEKPVVAKSKAKTAVAIEKVNNSEIVKNSNGTKNQATDLKSPQTSLNRVKDKAGTLIKNISITPTFLASLLAVVVVLGVASYLIIQYNKYRQDPEITISHPPSNHITEENSVEIRGFTNPANLVLINNETVSLDTDGNFTYNVRLTEGVNQIDVTVKRTEQDDGITETLTVIYEEPFIPEPDEIEDEPIENDTPVVLEHTISFEMTEDVWIKLTIDSENPINTLLKAGQEAEYTWENSFTVSIGKPKTTTVIVDGEERESVVNSQTGVGRVSCNVRSGTLSCN